MGITETLAYIHNVKWQGSKPGLERTQELLRLLGNPEKQLKFVHVAGTNGKGSTCACIATVLTRAGYRTGMYTSPFVECFNERMQVNGEHITDDELEGVIDEIRPFTDAMADSPTEFELITAVAMKHFLNKKCDIVVLEVGMGGRLDSTNVIETPELAVITAIGYDHVKELGPALTDIAREKAGIIKSGGDVLIYGNGADLRKDGSSSELVAGSDDVESVFKEVATERGAKMQKADFSRITSYELTLGGIKFDFRPYGEIMLPLVGSYQPYNATVAITALEMLREKGYKITDDDIVKGIASVKWQGRFEILGHNPTFILDAAHNQQGMEATADSLRRHFGSAKVVFIVGVMADKDIDNMFSHLAPLAKCFITVTPDNPRSMPSSELAEYLKRFGVPVTDCGSVSKGVSEALAAAGETDIICALGSLYFHAEIKAEVSRGDGSLLR